MPVCLICDTSAPAEYHFGGISCRACAAFFRRYVHSKKQSIRCVCNQKSLLKPPLPCRQCRMEKCLEAGMKKSKVQPFREPNAPERCIPNRDVSNIQSTSIKWMENCEKRKTLYGENIMLMNIYEVSCRTKTDSMIVWKMVEDLFPSLRTLKTADKTSLMSNFMSKFLLMEYAFDTTEWPIKLSADETELMVYNFYNDAMPETRRMGMKDALEIFWPFWTCYCNQVIVPIHEKKSDLLELMAQILLVLFDPAYINISVECAEVCRQLRNLILRELKGYLAEKNQSEDQDHRFFDLLDNLRLLENAEKRFQEELQTCELYHVRLHDDFRKMVMVEKL